ncbi:MAG: RIO1 family regulatory kinase/ATPase [Candidatus Hodarchaeota archaeon]
MSPAAVEKFNPKKRSALSSKRELQRGGKRAKDVPILEVTLDDVRKDAIQFGLATDVLYQVSSGKEASIFLALWNDHPIILKAYRLWRSAQARKAKGFNALAQMDAIASREFDYLFELFHAGVKVPTPIGRVGNYLTMRFIGDGTDPAPQLKDVVLKQPEKVLDQILDDYLIVYRDAHFVHGDLSKYNILWWKNQHWIIDVPQARRVNTWSDMHSIEMLLRRDINNLLNYFKGYGIQRDAEEILETMLSEYIPHNLRNYRETVSTHIEDTTFHDI